MMRASLVNDAAGLRVVLDDHVVTPGPLPPGTIAAGWALDAADAIASVLDHLRCQLWHVERATARPAGILAELREQVALLEAEEARHLAARRENGSGPALG